MSIISEISRIESAASSIKSKVNSLGLSVSSPSKLGEYANALNSIATPSISVSKLTADTTSVTIAKGYYGSNSTISVDKMDAPIVELSSTAQTISCDDKIINGNITIPSVNVFSTGSNVPPDSSGNDGDLFLVV